MFLENYFQQLIKPMNCKKINSTNNVELIFYIPKCNITNATKYAPSATVKRLRLKYARITATIVAATALQVVPVLPKTAGNVIAESTA